MNYEKKYKEALENARQEYNTIENVERKQWLEEIFPELKESEDEKIKNEIIKFLELPHPQFVGKRHQEEWIAWLEKQGERKHKFIIGDIISNGNVIYRVDNIVKNCIGQDCYFLVNVESEKDGTRYYKLTNSEGKTSNSGEITWLCEQVDKSFEKQGEQKPNPYSGTSFEYNGHTWGMCARDYGVEILFDGELKAFISSEKSFIYPIHPQPSLIPKSAQETINKEKVEPKFHEGEWITNGDYTWKIVEVMPLDYILQSQDGNMVDDTISYVDEQFHSFTIEDAKDGDVLVHNYITFIFKEIEDGIVKGFCSELSDSILNFGMPEYDKDYYPATKEQRDLLFINMNEAGYEWNAEKKELKKIDNEEVNGEDYGIDGLWHAQRILENTLGSVDGYQTDDGILDHKAAITAVKKLYEQKPTWSEEDEKHLNRAINILDASKVYTKSPDKYEDTINWLKFLKFRNTWKPSDEQMGVIEAVINNRSFQRKHLDSLYEQLKKLKGE